MRLLFLAHRVPYPPDKGDKIRSYHEIRHLALRHEVELIAFADRAEDLAHEATLRGFLSKVTLLPLRPGPHRLRSLAALPTGGSLSVRYFSPAPLRAAIERALVRPFDAVFAYSSTMAALVRTCSLPVIVDFVDVDSEKFVQYGRTERRPMRWLFATEGRRLRAYERELAATVPLSLVCTKDEARVLRSFAAPRRLEVVENGVDLDRHGFAFATAARPVAVFVGAMDYLANVDACEAFCRDVLPLVRSELPDFQLRIVGRDPGQRVWALHDGDAVVVTGAVPDVGAELHRAHVSVAPLRIARGIQNKVLEAFAAGTPVVATRAAAEGIDAEHDRELLIADAPGDFARAVVQLVRDRSRARVLAQAARELVERRYRWDVSLARLEQLVIETVARVPPAPAAGGVESKRVTGSPRG